MMQYSTTLLILENKNTYTVGFLRVGLFAKDVVVGV